VRRLLTLLVLLLVPTLAVLPAQANGLHKEFVRHTPLPKHHAKKAHAKKTPIKKTPAKKTHKKKSHKKKTPTPVRAKATSRPKPTATKAAKPAPTATSTLVPTATATFTPTPTPTLTPTPTPTPTPLPARAALDVSADVAAGHDVAFVVCGLPDGATASFDPNPARSFSAAVDTAKSALTVFTPYTLASTTSLLAIHASYVDSSGTVEGAGAVHPRAAILTVDGNGQPSLQPSDTAAAEGNTNCSPLPASYVPPTPALTNGSVSIASSVSDTHPYAGETVTITGSIQVGGRPASGVLMRTNWYFPTGVQSCDASTGADGTAACSLPNTNPSAGYVVQIQVVFEYEGQQFTTYSSYIM
jgi:hypothetical protein